MSTAIEQIAQPEQTVEPNVLARVLDALRPQLDVVLKDSGIPVASFEVAVLQAGLQEPDLLRCTIPSLTDSILTCARLRLMPVGFEEHAKFVVRHSSGLWEAQCMVMVHGLTHLATRDGGARSIDGETVREGETYRFSKLANVLEHEPIFPRNEKIIAAYSFADMRDGSRIAELMDIAELEAAEAASGGNIVWRSHRARMCIKSAKKRLVLTRGLLSSATTSALARVRLEGDTRVASVPGTEPASATSTEAATPARSDLSPSANKLLGKINAKRVKPVVAAKSPKTKGAKKK